MKLKIFIKMMYKSKKKKIVLAGRNTLAVSCLDSLIKFGMEEKLVVIPSEKSKDMTQKNLKLEAQKRKIFIYEGDINQLSFSPEIVFSVSFDQKLKEKILNESLCINLHLSPLPKYGGSNIFYWALKNNEKEWAVTLHKMELDFDVGDIIDQKYFKIEDNDTARTLYDRAVEQASKMFSINLEKIIHRNFQLKKQDLTKRTFYKKNDVDFNKEIILTNPELRARIFPPYKNPIVIIGDKKYILTEKKD